MTYDELAQHIEQLSYRDKFRLASLLIQLARKEEEETHPEQRSIATATSMFDLDIQCIADKLRKLKPSKKERVLNSIGSMFQFQGGISDRDKEKIFSELQKARHIDIGENGRIHYP